MCSSDLYAITTGLLYTWRRQVLGGQMTGLVRSTPGFAQVEVVPPHLEAAEPIAEQPLVPPEAVVPPRPQEPGENNLNTLRNFVTLWV